MENNSAFTHQATKMRLLDNKIDRRADEKTQDCDARSPQPQKLDASGSLLEGWWGPCSSRQTRPGAFRRSRTRARRRLAGSIGTCEIPPASAA